MAMPDNAKKVYSATDSAPTVLYAKRDPSSEHAFPIVASTSGSLVISAEETISQMFFDYDVRTDGQPVYIGYGSIGLATSADGWLLYKHTYNANGYITSRQVAYGAWDNRTSVTYA